MKKIICGLVSLIIILSFTGCNMKESIFSVQNEKKVNQQIKADTLLDRQIPNNPTIYNYSFVNGDVYLDAVYIFNTDPDVLLSSQSVGYLELWENNYLKKYSYLYLNGEKDMGIQVQLYTRDEIDDQPWFSDQYYYTKSSEHQDKLQTYHSYGIGISGTVFDGEFYDYKYDENNKLIERIDDRGYSIYFYYDQYGILDRRTFEVGATYDEKYYSYEVEDGNIIRIFSYNAQNNNITNRYEYEYDSSNRIIKESIYNYYENYYGYTHENVEKSLIGTTSYVYDADGNISNVILEQYDSENDEFDTTYKYYYYNENNNLVQMVVNRGNSTTYYILEYTDNPKVFEIESDN